MSNIVSFITREKGAVLDDVAVKVQVAYGVDF